jgi:hypothetical protein
LGPSNYDHIVIQSYLIILILFNLIYYHPSKEHGPCHKILGLRKPTPRRATHIFGFELAGGGHFGQNAACQTPKKIMPFATSQVEGDVKNSNAGKTITNHPPVITIFIGGMNHSQSWVVYGIVLATLHTSNRNE